MQSAKQRENQQIEERQEKYLPKLINLSPLCTSLGHMNAKQRDVTSS